MQAGRLMRQQAARIRFDQADEKIGNVDGSPWIRNQIERRPESAAHHHREVAINARLVRKKPLQRAVADMKQASQILKACEDIDRLESEADRVLRSAMSKLFREEDNVKTLIKLKAVYELLETITDKCEDVANILEGIVLENA